PILTHPIPIIMRPYNLFLFILIIVGINISCDSATEQTVMENPVDATQRVDAPNFTLNSLDGDEVTLSDLRGNVIYLFFFGSNCPHCLQNGPVTENVIFQRFKDEPDFLAFGLDTWNTSASSVIRFQSTTGITYPMLLQARETLRDYYGNTSDYDRSVVIDKEGKIAYRGTVFVNRDADAVANIITQELSN
ncbi:MAG: redoxin family protein, partial [Bacteroidota bacterium]